MISLGFLSSNFSTEVLKTLPLVYWRLGEPSGGTANDTAGHSGGPYNGTYTGGGVTLNQTGAIVNDTNKAIATTATGYVIGTVPSVAYPFTVMTYATINSLTSGEYIVMAIGQKAALEQYWLGITPLGSGDFQIRFLIQGGGSNSYTAGNVHLGTGSSYHQFAVIATSGTSQTIVVDGVTISTSFTGGSITPAGIDSLFAGILVYNGSSLYQQYEGKIDEVVVWTYALTVAQLNRLFLKANGQ